MKQQSHSCSVLRDKTEACMKHMRETGKRTAEEEEGKGHTNRRGLGNKNSKVKTQSKLIKGLQKTKSEWSKKRKKRQRSWMD